eukprot:40555-Chlamydomonas_euryale.AAC.7
MACDHAIGNPRSEGSVWTSQGTNLNSRSSPKQDLLSNTALLNKCNDLMQLVVPICNPRPVTWQHAFSTSSMSIHLLPSQRIIAVSHPQKPGSAACKLSLCQPSRSDGVHPAHISMQGPQAVENLSMLFLQHMPALPTVDPFSF